MALPINVTNPGLVNVADEAYPPVPPTFQALPEQLSELLAGSLFAGPLAGVPGQALPVAAFVEVESQARLQPSFSSGFATPGAPEFDVGDQNLIGVFTADFVVTEVGSFQTNPTNQSDIVVTIVSILDAETLTAPGVTTQIFRISLNTDLSKFGVPIPGRLMTILTGAPPLPDKILVVTLASFNVVFTTNPFYTGSYGAPFPAPGDTMVIDISREGFEVINDLEGITTNTFPSTNTLLPFQDPVDAEIGLFLGNLFATDGVVRPFIGSGVQAPPFIGTFEVEDQPLLSKGLPTNVFV